MQIRYGRLRSNCHESLKSGRKISISRQGRATDSISNLTACGGLPISCTIRIPTRSLARLPVRSIVQFSPNRHLIALAAAPVASPPQSTLTLTPSSRFPARLLAHTSSYSFPRSQLAHSSTQSLHWRRPSSQRLLTFLALQSTLKCRSAACLRPGRGRQRLGYPSCELKLLK